MNYGVFCVGLGLFFGIWACIEAESVKGRIFIITTMLCIFFLPVIWHRLAAYSLSYIAWAILGIGCYIFIKLRGVGIR